MPQDRFGATNIDKNNTTNLIVNKTEEFKQLLNNKYGEEIATGLFKEGELQTDLIKKTNEVDQEKVKKHLIRLRHQFNLNFNVDERPWAFDFPGWTGRLDFDKQRVKKYMIIGLEPHIAEFDFQITYGLSDSTPIDNVKRFSIEPSKKDFIQCKNDSSVIWTNLFKIFSNDNSFSAVIEKEDKKSLDEFLNQFYITDLCHFAPQGKANTISKIQDWAGVRSIVANQFLKKEIELINPEVVITQGGIAFDKLSEIIEVKDIQGFNIAVGKQNNSIKYGINGKTKILSIPHIGSLMTNRTFWIKNLQEVKSKLKTKGILSDT